MKKTVEVIIEPEKAKVLVDPMRREMVSMLAERPMTEKELAQSLGLSDPSVGHHLKILSEAGLVRIGRKEVEQHGIVQKFYETNALVYFIDERIMPLEIERYFMAVSLERARGAIAALSALTGKLQHISTDELEEFAKTLNSTIVSATPRYSRSWRGSREELISTIYRDALIHLLQKANRLPEKLRDFFLDARKRSK
jgi:DNA-binding transcriptional ArsR family regulator